jgi:membrane-associated phospholipid phosphatase
MGFISPTAPLLVDKYRPYTYFDETPMPKRINKVSRNSFFAGHAAVAGVGFFCGAKIYGDYYPESSMKWVLYGVATAGTVTTAWLRVRSGQHFISDTILGTATGVLAGILVPHYHKVKDRSALGVLPFNYGDVKGLRLVYRFQ